MVLETFQLYNCNHSPFMCVHVCVMCVEWAGESGEVIDSEPAQNSIVMDMFHRVTSLECHAHLYSELLQERSVDGHTPFMAAISYKVLFSLIHTI